MQNRLVNFHVVVVVACFMLCEHDVSDTKMIEIWTRPNKDQQATTFVIA